VKKCRAGLNFVHGELIGWLWFAIGGSHVNDFPILTPVNISIEKRRDVAVRKRRYFKDVRHINK